MQYRSTAIGGPKKAGRSLPLRAIVRSIDDGTIKATRQLDSVECPILQETPVKVSAIMSSPVVTVHLDDRLSVVQEIFGRTRFHHLIVVEQGKLFGVVSDRDLLKAISPNIGKRAERDVDAATLNKRVHQIMSRKPIFLREDDSVLEAIRLFDEHAVSCLPVVNHDDAPVGILSWRDLIRAMRAISQREKS